MRVCPERRALASANGVLLFLALLPAMLSFALWSYVLPRRSAAEVASSLYLVPVLTFPTAWI